MPLKQRKPINKISKKRLEREFHGKIPYSTVGRSSIGKITDFESVELGSTPRRPAKPIIKVSTKQAAKQANLNKIRIRWWDEGRRECGICHCPISSFNDYVLDHRKPRGMGGGKRDDSEENLQPAHYLCNLEKGSKRT